MASLVLLNTTSMQLGIPLEGNPHKQQIISILCNLNRILLAHGLLDVRVNSLVVFQLNNDGIGIYIFARIESTTSKSTQNLL